MNSVIRVVLPLPPNRANDRSHWRKVHRTRSGYLAAAWTRAIAQTKATERGFRMAPPMKVTATLYVWAKMDDDNAVARLKWPLDALKHAGLLRDDKRPWCTLTGIPEQTIDRANPRIELTLERVAA